MAHFIKTGFWEKAQYGFKGWLNLDQLIELIGERVFVPVTTTPVALTNAATMDLAETNQTLTSSQATRTFTISSLADDITLEVILNTTAATYTFPATALTVSEGVASGTNILALSGVSGDHYIIGIKKIGSNYYVISKNFGQ